MADQDGKRSPLAFYQNGFRDAALISMVKERKQGYADGVRDLEIQLNNFESDLRTKIEELGKPLTERDEYKQQQQKSE